MDSMLDAFLKGCEEEFNSGNKWALMNALMACAHSRAPMPGWASKAYLAAFEACRTAKVKSWDDVFGEPWPKGTSRTATHRRLTTMWPLFHEINKRKIGNPALPIGVALFEEVGQQFGIGKTLASEFYYEAKRLSKLI